MIPDDGPPTPTPRTGWQPITPDNQEACTISPIPDGSDHGCCMGDAYDGRRVSSVGWLGHTLPDDDLPRSELPDELLDVLGHAAVHHRVDDGLMGKHICCLCGRYHDHCEFWIEAGGRTWVLPMMVFHYVVIHGYRPPTAFVDAIADLPRDIPDALRTRIRAGCSPETGEYHDQILERMRRFREQLEGRLAPQPGTDGDETR